jgi:hypothetical protein
MRERGKDGNPLLASSVSQDRLKEAADRITELEKRIELYALCMNTGGADELHSRIAELETLNAELTAKLREAEQDAKRYREIRAIFDEEDGEVGFASMIECGSGDELDEYIDRAIGNTTEGA